MKQSHGKIYDDLINKKYMKKVLGILSILAIMILSSCGNNASKETTTGTDSLAVEVDSSAVTANNATTAEIPTESQAEIK